MRVLFAFLFCLNFVFGFELLRLSEYDGRDVGGWLVSEKLDGVRAFWDGENLLSRNGKILNAPREFTANFPTFELDGELYTKRGEFEKIQSIVMDKTPNLKAWSEIKFHVFDVPRANGGLLKRLEKLENYLDKNQISNIKVIKQIKIKDNAELDKILDDVIKNGGEGVVVREPNAPYEPKRSKNALKVKKFKDAECEVVAINKGSGKYANLMGSITCEAVGETQNLKSFKKDEIARGVRFKIGSGFSDEMRKNPPKIGEIVTFKYQNLTANGVPRFPVFLRVRGD